MVSSLIVFGRNAAGFGICSTADRVPKIPRISRVVARFGPLSASLKVREQRLPRAEKPAGGRSVDPSRETGRDAEVRPRFAVP
jgi:hypothetical protein